MTETAFADCTRSPATDIGKNARPAAGVSAYLTNASKFLEAAYPALRLHHDDKLYVVDGATPYRVDVHFDHDEESGYAALTLSYNTSHDAALRSGGAKTGTGCRSAVELVVGHLTSSGVATIVTRGVLDAEAAAIDVRTLDVDVEDGAPAVNFLYFAYYGSTGWFGHVGWRARVSLDQGRLVTQRLPASYLKLSAPDHRMEGYLSPAGHGPGVVRLLTMGFGTKGETEMQFDVGANPTLSGVDILRQVP